MNYVRFWCLLLLHSEELLILFSYSIQLSLTIFDDVLDLNDTFAGLEGLVPDLIVVERVQIYVELRRWWHLSALPLEIWWLLSVHFNRL